MVSGSIVTVTLPSEPTATLGSCTNWSVELVDQKYRDESAASGPASWKETVSAWVLWPLQRRQGPWSFSMTMVTLLEPSVGTSVTYDPPWER